MVAQPFELHGCRALTARAMAADLELMIAAMAEMRKRSLEIVIRTRRPSVVGEGL
jgi:hypothetical protein